MPKLISYLNFDGNCHEAMKFYQASLGGELTVMNFDEAQCGPGTADRIMHSHLTQSGDPFLMASDTMPGTPRVQGNSFAVTVACESREHLDRLYKGLGESGQSTMPPADMFWGDYFGMLTDRFGVNWMFNFATPKAA